MPAKEPGWWYGEHRGPMARLLGPISRVWAYAAERRINRATPYRASLPVICVGNFTAGGTGKTPLAIHIAGLLTERGERPAFLTRGYGGRQRGPHRVDAALDTAADVGDEPLLLARHAPVMVARDRVAGARAIEAQAGVAPPTVIVMDDGLQNPALAKDLVVAVVDGRRGTGNGLVIPAGPLRAPLALQLGIADAIVVNLPCEMAADGAVHSNGIAAGFRDSFDGPVLEAKVEAAGETAALAGQRVLPLAGIANPARFYGLLAELGADIVARAEFADHHAFSQADARGVLAKADQLGARIVTTEKDWARLAGGNGALGELAARAWPLPIRLAFAPRDATRLAALIDSALIERRRGLGRVKP